MHSSNSPLPHLVPLSSKLRYLPVLIETSDRRKTDHLHWHDHVQIWYILGGTMKQIINNEEYIQKPGSCALILPYMIHNIDTRESEGAPHILSISFTDRFINDLGHPFFSYFNEYAHFDGRQIPIFTEFSDRRKETADALVGAMLDEFSRHKDMSFEKLGELLVSFLRLLCDGSEPAAPCKKHIFDRANDITNVVKFMMDHYHEKIGIDDFCAVSLMSRSRFTSSFKSITGKTAIEFLHSLRISQAMQILMASDKTTAEVASLVGLSDKSHLSRAFRDMIGMSPKEYRRLLHQYYTESDEEYRKRWEWFDEKDFEPYYHS